MKWISKILKQVFAKIKLNKIASASVAIFLVLLLKKLSVHEKSGKQIVSTMTESISSFYDKLRNNQITKVDILTNSISYRDLKQNIFQAVIPKHAQGALQQQLIKNKISFNYAQTVNKQSAKQLLVFVLWALIGFILYYLYNIDFSEMGTASKPHKTITFENIVGLEQSKQALTEIIQYMKEPQKFVAVGARMRRGIIFYGPSGTGKTTLAKATAGEAGVPFFSCNASQFCEMYVGVGPKRVKQLFKKAKQAAPSIIYIDEIDAIGNRKQTGLFNQGSNSQKNSTINQLLSEMDGFASQENILVIGSTNRVEMIDTSLLRAGRFDLKIRIPLPDDNDRFQILKYHLSMKKHSISDQSLRKVTSYLEGWSGADLQNVANQSVYASLRVGSPEITEGILIETVKKLKTQMNH